MSFRYFFQITSVITGYIREYPSIDGLNIIFIVKCCALFKYEPVHEISNNLVCATNKASDQPAHTRSLIRAFASSLSIL